MSNYRLKTIINKNFKPIRFRSNGKPHYEIFLEIESETDPKLEELRRVEYVLHPSFKDRIRTSSERENNFQIQIKAWGTFVVTVKLIKANNAVEEFQQNMKDNWVESYL
jgi:transcription initiation factor IIF auxiliary subunit